jgi:membrane-associated protease RseP (regulator of RpoE activity)
MPNHQEATMRNLWNDRSRIAWLAIAACAAVAIAARAQAADPNPEAGSTVIEEKNAKEYWIGVQAAPVDPGFRAALNLPGDHGLLVLHVIPDGPAAKAGLRVNDVLLSAGGQDLGDVGQLHDVVNRARGEELKLTIYRHGNKETVTLRPVERPQPGDLGAGLPAQDREALRRWVERMQSGSGAPMAFRFFHPGMVMPGEGVTLPDDTNVTINKQGKQPAKITVKRGDKTWETTEDKLSELPPEIRAMVLSMLPAAGLGQPLPELPQGLEGQPAGMFVPPLERRLQQMNNRLEQLQQRLDQVERRLATKPTPEPGS